MTRPFFLFVGLSFLHLGTLFSAEPSPAEAKMRENLRATMLQLRAMQTQRDTLELAKTEAEQKNEMLTAQMEAAATKATAEKEAAEKSVSELTTKSTAQAAEIAELKTALEEWKAAQKKAAELAAVKEAERAKLAAQGADLQRHVADQRTKNLAMYKIGSEVLSRYEKFGLGTALAAREPFVGTMKVKLENLVQDYSDKLAEQRIKP